MRHGARWVFISACLGALSLLACGSDDDTDKGSGGATGSGGASGSGGSSASGGSGGSGATCSGSAADIQRCKDDAVAEGNCPEVYNCACDNCACKLETCQGNAACTAIRKCAQDNGCTGVGCYFGACRDTIDNNGGPTGPGAALAQSLSDCFDAASCQISCGGGTGGSGSGGTSGAGGTAGAGTGGSAGSSGGSAGSSGGSAGSSGGSAGSSGGSAGSSGGSAGSSGGSAGSTGGAGGSG